MNIGVIGVGTMGKNHVRIYSELKGVDNIYVYDINEKQAKSLKEDVTVCSYIDTLLSYADAVSICVPTMHHFKVAKKAIEKGVHCLIEKPITSTITEEEHLLQMCKDTDLVIGVGHTERFNPIISEIKKIVKKPLLIGIARHNPGSARINDTSIVEDLMIHDIDILFNVLLPDEAYKVFSSGDSDFCVALFDFTSTTAWLSASRKAKKKIRKIYIEEEDFTLEGDFMNQEIYVYRHPSEYVLEDERYVQESVIEKVLVNKVEPLREELKTFIKCAREGKEFPVTPLQGLNNLMKCDEILERR
ncbi:unnamed protein product [marine sediment metagenome]|uniref:Gfo/Idh/MocA-like oxidoreductase N-terminal domain-containing protein n=1 Tax=marine sediment metagenome TaxID=412755 RepID=X1DXC1_9ZZZZ